MEGRITCHSSPTAKSSMLLSNSTIIFMLFRYIRWKYLHKYNHVPNELYSNWDLFIEQRSFFWIFTPRFLNTSWYCHGMVILLNIYPKIFKHFMVLSCCQLHPMGLNTAKKNTDKKRVKSERRNRPTVNAPDALSGSQGWMLH